MKQNKRRALLIWIGGAVLLLLLATVCSQLFPSLQFSKWFSKTRATLTQPMGALLRYFGFDERNALKQWQEKIFQGRVKYWVEVEGSGGFLHSESLRSASAIFYHLKFDISDYPILSWKWRVGKFPDKQAERDAKKRDDYAARVYVIFAKGFFTNFKCVEYAWDEFLPEGTRLESPYSEKIEQFVIQTGRAGNNEWIQERQNVYEDYRKLFGEKPKMKVIAIALMTDSEGTGTEAEGFFDDIQIGKLSSSANGKGAMK